MVYLNRYDRALKKWKSIKFIEGLGLQSAEMNELQSIIMDEVYQLGRTLWSEGEVIRGCELTIGSGIARLSAGQIYFGGYVHDFPASQIAITGVGREVIGVTFTSRISSEGEDADLFDPCSDIENAGYRGAHRQVYDLTMVRNNAAAMPLYALQDGMWSADYRPKPQASTIAATMARRTYDESGDYLVRGLRCSVGPKDASQFWVNITAGKAYVRGTEFVVPSQTRIAIDRPVDVATMTDEAKVYSTGTNSYALNNNPIKSVNDVTGLADVTVQMTKGAAGGMDLVPYNILSPGGILSVVMGGTTYVANTDYTQVGNYINWSPGGAEPTQGNTYMATVRYSKSFEFGVDYTVTGQTVDFSLAGANPVNGSTFYVDYEYYQSRNDLVAMNAQGVFRVIEGVPGIFAADPKVPADMLPIAFVRMTANSAHTAAVVSHTDRYRLTMHEIARLRDRIEDLEYNVAVTDLEQAAINVQLPTSKKSIFTDSFRNGSKMNAGDNTVSCAIGVAGDHLDTLYPKFAVNFHDLELNTRFALRPYTHLEVISQPHATDVINVNPYAVYNNAGVLALTPAADVWIENSTVYTKETNDVLVGTGRLIRWLWWEQWTERTLMSEVMIQGTSAAKTVNVVGSAYFPFSDNLKLVFDGVLTPLSNTGGTLPGTDPESIKADQNGGFTASFTVPAGTKNGAHSVVIYNIDNIGSTQYLIDGRLRTWLEATTIVRHGERYTPYDPIAQSFSVEYDMFVSAVDLFFSGKPPSNVNIPVVVSIRNTVNGYPGQQILAEKTVLRSQVNTSLNGSVATRVNFEYPAYIREGVEYCIVVTTLSNAYHLHYAFLGHKDKITGLTVLTNPATGVMFTSANASAWTAEQRADLKFTLYRASFGTADQVITLPATGTIDVDGSNIMIMCGSLEPAGTDIVWDVRVDNAGPWIRTPDNINVDLGVMADRLQLRATLKGTDILSPVLFGSMGLVVAKWDSTGKYGTRTIDVEGYTGLRVYMDVSVPAGTSVHPWYCTNGTLWNPCPAFTNPPLDVSPGWQEREYIVTDIQDATSLQLVLNMTSSSDRLRVPRVRRLRVIAI